MNDSIKTFVREILGCDCPDEVLRQIDCERNIRLNQDVVLKAKVNVGNRLIIYIMEIDDASSLENNLAAVVACGKEERNRKGFNRFRLVLAGDNINELQQTADQIFINGKIKDSKIHLHYVEKKNLHYIS